MSYADAVRALPVREDTLILGIETSCDETAVSLVRGGREVLADEIISSAAEHAKFGGVVPEIASRAHTEAISVAAARALKAAGVSLPEVDAVAVTYGAGLLGALLVGVSYAKSLAFALNKPLIPVSHIRGHMAAAYLADKTLEPPFLSLLTSGGHTALIHVSDYEKMEVLGGTLDDAVGEAFDKVARVLGLSYPGGPAVERLAREGRNIVPLPKMLKGAKGYDVSYSGLKTAVINYVHTREQRGEDWSRADVACSFQHAALDVLVEKAVEAAQERGLDTVVSGGGVAANGYLRSLLAERCAAAGIKAVIPDKKLCTDNASMIAAEGYLQYRAGNFADLSLNAAANVPLK